MEKASKYLNETEVENPSLQVKSDKPFALAMRFNRYIRAFKEQMKDNLEVDENKYNLLKISHDKEGVRITHSFEAQQLELIDESTGESI